MDQVTQALINGIMLGGFYAVMVLGFSIIWGVMGVINLAHGEFVMLGAYLTWMLNGNLAGNRLPPSSWWRRPCFYSAISCSGF